MKRNENSKKVVLICGSSRGIGFFIGKKFLENGNIVVFSSRFISKKAHQFVKLFIKYKNQIFIKRCDFSKKNSISNLKKKIIKKFKRLDILVTNSGMSSGNLNLPLKYNEIDHSINQNFKTCLFPIEVFLKNLIRSRGNVVAISSIAGIEYISAPISYSASKSAVNTLIKSLSKIYGNRIRINGVSPGNILFDGSVWDKKLKKNKSKVLKYIKNNVPQNKFGTADDIANAVLFLSSNNANFINGEVLVVDGGQLASFS